MLLKYIAMDLRIAQLELIEMLLNTRKKNVLDKIRTILETEQNDLSLTEEHYKIIDKRRQDYINGKGEASSWKQVKQNALKAIS